MRIKEYQDAARIAVQSHDNEKDEISHWVIGLTEEAGEVASLVKHKYYNNDEVSLERIAEELGDTLWYIAAICNGLHISMEKVAELNCAKLANRYDGEYSDQAVAMRHSNMNFFRLTSEYMKIVEDLEEKE